MKHVFLIHSNTVLLSALGAMDYECLKHKDVLFLYSRGFKSSIIDEDIKIVDVSNLQKIEGSDNFTSNILKHYKLIKSVDAFVEREIADEYHFYVPHVAMPFFQMFVTNRHCVSTSLLQEGAFSFFGRPLFVGKTRIKNLLFSNKRMWWDTTWDIPKERRDAVKLRKTYATNAEFFRPLHEAENIVIHWPKLKDQRLQYPENSNFFLFESAVEQQFLSIDDYVDCCRQLIQDSGVKKCFLKFHPNQKSENIEKLKSLFEGIEYSLVDNTIPFELILSSNKNLNLYGFSTSLLKFGEDFGHHVTCYLSMLCQKSKDFEAHIMGGSYGSMMASQPNANTNKKIAFIIPYFGKFNEYFSQWLMSCRYNPTIDWLLYTDCQDKYDFPDNVKVHYVGFDDLRKKFQSKFDFEISLKQAYKFCDFRPAYGDVFEEELRGYDYWGYCDVDLIWGNIRRFLSGWMLEKNDRIGIYGHCSIIRNTREMRELYKRKIEGVPDCRTVFSSDLSYCFDESRCFNKLFDAFGYKMTELPGVFDVNMKRRVFSPGNSFYDVSPNEQCCFGYKEGKLTCYFRSASGVVLEREAMYVHLQKREVKSMASKDANSFLIIPNAIIPYTESIGAAYDFKPMGGVRFDYIKLRWNELKNEISGKHRFYRYEHQWIYYFVKK